MARILVAAAPEPGAVIDRILSGHEIAHAETMAQAERLLRERSFDLIICTIVFDGSKLFEFLQLAKSRPEWRRIPFVGARVRSTLVRSPALLRTTAFTCGALGAEAFLDIADYQVDPDREMREAIERFIVPAAGSVGDR